MSVDPEFANAVRAGIGARKLVPCFKPCTNIKLLQLLSRVHVQRTGLFNRGGHILANSGNSDDDLIYFVREMLRQEQQARELQEIVRGAAVSLVMPFSVERSVVTRLGLGISFNQLDEDLARVGLRATSDVSWNLTFGDGPITKETVSLMQLHNFLHRYGAVPEHPVMQNYMGLVTAVYYVTGGLTYTGKIANVTTLGGQFDPAAAGFNMTAGWSGKVIGATEVVVSQTNSEQWIVAIEFMDFRRI
jgi:hypothetical protein